MVPSNHDANASSISSVISSLNCRTQSCSAFGAVERLSNSPWVNSLKVLKVGGRLLTCGATAGYAPTEDIRFIWTFELKVLGSNGWARSDIETLLKLVQEGKLKVLVDKIFPLAEAPAALAVIEDRQVFGKVVVAP